MKEPKVTLKKIKTFLGIEGYGVNADVYINGKLACTAIDSGDGGEMYFQPNYNDVEQSKALIKALEDYCATQPKIKITDKFFVDYTMEDYINNLLVEMVNKKEQKRMNKLFQTAIVFGKPNDIKYNYLDYKKPLSTVNKNALQFQIDVVRKEHCKNGVVILNTNLKELGIN